MSLKLLECEREAAGAYVSADDKGRTPTGKDDVQCTEGLVLGHMGVQACASQGGSSAGGPTVSG
jgi:hypothetical protein